MLSLQSSTDGSAGFLAGRSEMAKRIAEFDWEQHPFGPIRTWPQSLRSALSICLQSRFPTALYWGPELRLLYNDAWAPIPGPRHPGALGARAQDVWSDIWHDIGPQLRTVISTGEGLFVEDQFLPMARFGAPEETYWSYSFTPIRGEDGRIAGIFNSGSETTGAVLSQRQMRFFLDLSEHLRTARTLNAGFATAVQSLGHHLGVASVLYADFAENRNPALIARWSDRQFDCAHEAAVLAAAAEPLKAGERISVIDAADDSSSLGDALKAASWSSALAVSMFPAEHPTALLIALERPRAWNAFDESTLQEMLERLEAFRQRLLAEEREAMVVREVDHRARNAMAVAQSIVSLTFAEGGDDVRDNVRQRLGALHRSQVLLSAERWMSLDFSTLIGQELAPFPHIQANVAGPMVPLQPSLAQTLSLVVHELVTNSVKHGAMGYAGGALSIVWRLSDGTFEMDWSEDIPEERRQDKPSVPANGSGFGTTLIERVVRGQLRGTLDRDVSAHGFTCRLRIPMR